MIFIKGSEMLSIPLVSGRRVKRVYLDQISKQLGLVTEMAAVQRKSLEEYLSLEYPFNVIADPDAGGYVIIFPDLPGCLTQVENLDELPSMVEDVRRLWIEAAYEHGIEIPLPSYPEEYSGKFNLRLPRSLHRDLAESAEREGVSLNQYVVSLLSRGDALARVERKLAEIAPQSHDAVVRSREESAAAS